MRKIKFQNGNYYHIYNRGFEKSKIFREDKNFIRFLRGMREFNCLKPIESLYRLDQIRKAEKEAKPLRLQSNRRGLASLIVFIIAVFGFFFLAEQAQAATATGTITSQIKDIGVSVDFQIINWTASTTASSSITMKVRTATTSDMSSATDWASCNNVTSGADISSNNCVTDGERYIQYQAYLSADYATSSEFLSPELLDVTIKYESAGILISSVYNTLADDTVIQEIRWTETKPGSSDVLLQLRSSPDNSSWTDWLGPTGISDYYTDPSGGETINSSHSDGADDQWIQYKVILDSGGSDIPILSDLTIDYQASVPVITSVSPAMLTDNTAAVDLTINGSDFVAGATVVMASSELEITPTNISISSDQITCNFDATQAFGGTVNITVTNTNGSSVTWTEFYINNYVGTITSQINDVEPNLYFTDLTWTATTSATSSITMKVRTDSISDMSGAVAWASCDTVSNGADISANNCVTDGQRYIQYQATLTATYGTSTDYITPELGDVSVGYAHYVTASLISSPYNSTSTANVIRGISWTESLPTGTDIKFQIRTAPDSCGSPGSWTDWLGPMGTSDYYKNSDGNNAINLIHTDGLADQWFQYKVFLTSDGNYTPILSDLTIEYGEKQFSTIILKDGVILKDEVILR